MQSPARYGDAAVPQRQLRIHTSHPGLQTFVLAEIVPKSWVLDSFRLRAVGRPLGVGLHLAANTRLRWPSIPVHRLRARLFSRLVDLAWYGAVLALPWLSVLESVEAGLDALRLPRAEMRRAMPRPQEYGTVRG